MAKPKTSVPADALARYEKLVATQPGVDRKGATLPYTSVNGSMSSFLTPEGTLSLRLGDEDRALFLKRFRTSATVRHGTTLKDFVDVPASLFAKPADLAPWFAKSLTYAAELKRPKPAAAGRAKPVRARREPT
ncbi:MAG TPA: hypothetical protein VEI02_06260 [Planctomycetota bacterium]|nr:hypothetical protein [Planctomycetota bacterium]